MNQLSEFISAAFNSPTAPWDEAATRTLAALGAPSGLGGNAFWLISGDAHALWAQWFVESVADPDSYTHQSKTYAHVYQDVYKHIHSLGSQEPVDELNQLVGTIAQATWQEVERRRSVGRRPTYDRELRRALWSVNDRCWICGSRFPEWARARFLQDDTRPPPSTPTLLDFYRPRGKSASDLRVEVEHVLPHSSGGGSDLNNLRLACGWCNRAKGARGLLYDAGGSPLRRTHPKFGEMNVPQPFWVVRLLGMRQRCEDPSGCPARTNDSELTISLKAPTGSPNPANLIVVCKDHDPLVEHRYVARRFF